MLRIFAALATGLVSLATVAGGDGVAGPRPALAAEEAVSYHLDVQPILQSRCSECHTPPSGKGYEASGLDLSTYDGLMKGTKYGAVVNPGDPLTSNLNVLIEGRARPEVRMPHNQRPLLKAQQQIIHAWVKQGAKNN
jgi:mono/diheme cytochrome c family protein